MSKGKLLAICVLWLCIAGALAVTYRMVVRPTISQRRMKQTSSSSNYQHEARIGISGLVDLAVFRTPRFRELLTEKRIQLSLHNAPLSDDERLQELANNDIVMSSFGLLGFLQANAKVPDTPATIVAIISESRGADGIVAYRNLIPNAKGLNRPDLRILTTAGGSGESLVRLTMEQFMLDSLPMDSIEYLSDDGAVFNRYRQAVADQPLAYVLREPYLGRALENNAVHLLSGSNAFRGPLIQVLVASRDYLVKNLDVVRDVVDCYFRAAYHYREDMKQLIRDDLQRRGESLSDAELDRIVRTLRWKNTLENYAQFGIDFGTGLPLLEDAIRDTTILLQQTKGIAAGADVGSPTDLYFAKILEELKQAGFHPGGTGEGILSDSLETTAIAGAQWDDLIPVKSPVNSELTFARGSNRLLESSQVQLQELAAALASMPRTYVSIRATADQRGNLEANLRLANDRSQEVEKFLREQGIDPKRMRVLEAKPTDKASVVIELGQLPY